MDSANSVLGCTSLTSFIHTLFSTADFVENTGHTSRMLTEEELATRLYAHFNDRNIAAIFEILTPDVQWINRPKDIHVRGLEELRDHWEGYWKVATIELNPLRVKSIADGMLVDVRERISTPKDGLIFDGRVGHRYKLIEGKIAQCEIVDV